jgi:hypothetical protein
MGRRQTLINNHDEVLILGFVLLNGWSYYSQYTDQLWVWDDLLPRIQTSKHPTVREG